MVVVRRMVVWAGVAGITLYSIAMVAFGLLWSFAPQATWWLALSNVFAPLCFLPALATFPLALLMRKQLLIAVATLPILVFAGMFGALFLPRVTPNAPAGQDLRVATINQLYYGQNHAPLLAAIRQQEADIVAIQELHTSTAATLEQDFSDIYPYQYLNPSDGAGGTGVISRYPLRGVEQLAGGDNGIWVEIDGRRVLVVNVHIHFSGISRVRSQRFFGLPYLRMYDMYGRQVQVERLHTGLAPFTEPVIVLGDFNTGDREPGYQLMASSFRDVYRETSSGFGFTFPYQRRMGPLYIPTPLVRIDYIWTRGPLVPLRSSVRCIEGSDHCMVVADLRLGPE